VIGVHLAEGRTRKGTRVRYYCATWADATGHPRKRSFSVTKYGEEKAFELAVRARKDALASLLRPAEAASKAERASVHSSSFQGAG